MIKRFAQTTVIAVLIIFLLTITSCDPARKYEKAEKESITNFLKQNDSIEFTHETSGLYYHEVVAGTGRQPVLNDTAYVFYTGRYTDGTVFNTNVGGAILNFPVGEGYLISGFDEGVQYMKEGGKSTLLLPSNLAYGTQGSYPIPGYTALVFDVQLVKVAPGPSKK